MLYEYFLFFHPARRDGSQVLTRGQETANTSLSFMMVYFRLLIVLDFQFFCLLLAVGLAREGLKERFDSARSHKKVIKSQQCEL